MLRSGESRVRPFAGFDRQPAFSALSWPAGRRARRNGSRRALRRALRKGDQPPAATPCWIFAPHEPCAVKRAQPWLNCAWRPPLCRKGCRLTKYLLKCNFEKKKIFRHPQKKLICGWRVVDNVDKYVDNWPICHFFARLAKTRLLDKHKPPVPAFSCRASSEKKGKFCVGCGGKIFLYAEFTHYSQRKIFRPFPRDYADGVKGRQER